MSLRDKSRSAELSSHGPDPIDRTAFHVERAIVAPPAPGWVESRWPHASEPLAQFAQRLATTGVERGLIGPREVHRVWDRHLLNCAVAADVARPEASVLDLGSGAGLPGLVWALVRPDLDLTLVEPLHRRAGFLVEVVAELGLGSRVQVLRGRAEELAGSITADVVTSRAVAPWARLAGWSLPLVAPAGMVAALKGASASEELDRSADDLRRAGAGHAEVLIFGADVLEHPTRVVVIRRRDEGNEGTS